MSIQAYATVWANQLTPTQKLVGLAYADFADQFGERVFPAQATIAQMTGLGISSVRRATRVLEARGILIRQRRNHHGTVTYRMPVTGTTYRSNRYDVPLTPVPGTDNPSLTTIEPSAAIASRVLPIPRDGRTDSTATLSEEVQVDAVVDYFERAVRVRGPAQIIEGWRGDAAAKDMAKAFAEVFAPVDVTKSDSKKWLQGAARLIELGTTRAELVAARDEARKANQGRGAQLTHPGAVYEWIKGVRMRNPAPATAPASGRYVAREIEVNYDED